MTFAHRNASRLERICEQADRQSIVGKPAATRARLKRAGSIDILMGEVETEKNPVDGSNMYRRKNVSRVEPMLDMRWFEPALPVSIPRVLLVGDAAGSDALFGEGISIALGYGYHAAQAIQYARRPSRAPC